MDFFFAELVYHYSGLAADNEVCLFLGRYLESLDYGHKHILPHLQRDVTQG
jgi:hypothetical protein